VVSAASAHGVAGTWLLDPYDLTVAPSGGDVTGSSIQAALATSNVTLKSGSSSITCTGVACASGVSNLGNIYINDNISWSAGTSLTLNAYKDIYVGSATATGSLTLTGSANVVLTACGAVTTCLSGTANSGTGSVYMGMASSPTAGLNTGYWNGSAFTTGPATGFNGQINDSATSTITINGATYKVYLTSGTIDSSANYVFGSSVNQLTNVSSSVALVATLNNAVIYDGLGHVINYTLTLNNSGSTGFGLIGTANTGNLIVRNLGVSGSITDTAGTGTDSRFGGLIGYFGGGSITNSYSTVNINAGTSIGGLLGYVSDGSNATISNSYATGSVTAQNTAGGLVGYLGYNSTLKNSYATGSVTATSATGGNSAIGGLVGYAKYSTISYSYATGAVTASAIAQNNTVGGLIGKLDGSGYGSLSYSYATGIVTNQGVGSTGGLVGDSANWQSISNTFATGNVSASTASGYVGGLFGDIYNTVNSFTLTNSYASNTVTGPAFNTSNSATGGLIGQIGNGTNVALSANGGTLTNLYWDSSKTLQVQMVLVQC